MFWLLIFAHEGVWQSGGPVTPPTAPSSLTATELTCSGVIGDVELTFDDNSSTEDSWVVYKDGSLFDEVTSTTTSGTGQITITATGPLGANETATFTVAARNGAGDSAESAGSTFTSVDNVSTPSVTSSWNDGSGSQPACGVELDWGADSDACGWRVYRRLCGETSWTEIADVSGDSYFDTGVSEDTCYEYEVEAYNDRGTARSATESITTGTCEGGFD